MRFYSCVGAFVLMVGTAYADEDIIRHRNPAHLTESWAREFAESIELPASSKTIVLSGVGPTISNKEVSPNSVEAYGDTETQTRNVLEQIRSILAARGYTMSDIISMQALFVGDPNLDNQPDFEHFSKVYNEYFGTDEQPNVPARTRAQVLRLVPPGWLVEITVTAAKAK